MVIATRTPQRFRPLCILEAASVEKTEIETLDFTQVGKRKTRPTKQRAVTIKQRRVSSKYQLEQKIATGLEHSSPFDW